MENLTNELFTFVFLFQCLVSIIISICFALDWIKVSTILTVDASKAKNEFVEASLKLFLCMLAFVLLFTLLKIEIKLFYPLLINNIYGIFICICYLMFLDRCFTE